MKKLFLIPVIVIVLMTSISSDAVAQRAVKRYNHAIGANPLGLAFGMLNATYEQQVGPENSFTVNGLYWTLLDWSAFGIGGSYRWYLMQDDNKALKGFSFGPTINLGFWSYKNSFGYAGAYDGGTSVAIGAEANYKFVFDGGFMIEPGISFSFNAVSITGLSYPGFGIGANLGYAW